MRRVLSTAQDTVFGHYYRFAHILVADDPVSAFQAQVPVFDYAQIHDEWWHPILDEDADVTEPGTIPSNPPL